MLGRHRSIKPTIVTLSYCAIIILFRGVILWLDLQASWMILTIIPIYWAAFYYTRWVSRIMLSGWILTIFWLSIQPGIYFPNSLITPGLISIVTVSLMGLTQKIISQRNRLEHNLREQHEFLLQVIDTSPTHIYVKDRNGQFTLANRALADFYGVSVSELIGKRLADIHPHQEQSQRFSREDLLVMNTQKELVIPEAEVTDARGIVHWFNAVKRPFMGVNGKADQVLGISNEITELKHAQEALQQLSDYNRTLFDASPDPLVIIDQSGNINEANMAMEIITGCDRSHLIGKDFSSLFADPQKARESYQEALREGRAQDHGLDIHHAVGFLTPVLFNAAVYRDPDGKVVGVFAAARDISDRKRAEKELWYVSTHDSLTGLFNRAYFEGEMGRLEKSRNFPVSILMCDMNGLKDINDTYGHPAGDEMLRRTAQVLRLAFRGEDIAARIGGDEFAVILPKTDATAAGLSLERVRKALEDHNAIYPQNPLSLALGVASGLKGTLLMDIYKEADDRMYVDKKAAKRRKKIRGNTGVFAAD